MSHVQKIDPEQAFTALDLKEGDRFAGEFRDGKIILTITGDDETRESFADRWYGHFSGALERDVSDDPRAQSILDR